MIRIYSLTALLIVSLAHPSDNIATRQSAGDAAELTQIEHRLVKAWLDGDSRAIDSILGADWSVIDLTGHVLTKAQVMKELGGDRKIESGWFDDLNVRVFGDTAVVTGRSALTGSYQGKQASVTQRSPTFSSSAMGAGRWSPRRAPRSRSS